MAIVNGKLLTILDDEAEAGSVVFALCGYGNQIPRYANEGALVARATTIDIDAGTDGSFTEEVPGNDRIQPSGTYYTITVKNSNGDVIQINAYVFLGDNVYNLEATQPFDPTLPMMPLPPLIINQLLIVPASDSMTFSGTNFTAFKTTLYSNVLHPVATGMVPGNLYTFVIVQDGTGGWEFTWPANIHNGTMVNHDANAETVQTFVADADGQLYAISAGAYYP
jgi:hypothetical protein